MLYFQNVPILLAMLVLDAWMPLKYAMKELIGRAAEKKRARDLNGVAVCFCIFLICTCLIIYLYFMCIK